MNSLQPAALGPLVIDFPHSTFSIPSSAQRLASGVRRFGFCVYHPQMLTAQEIIERLGLRPLPVEGGWFRQTWVSSDLLPAAALDSRYGRARPAGTAIYYLLTDERDSFSALHRLPTDEVYHFYLGDPVEQLLLHPDGRAEIVVLGSDLAAGHRVQHVVPRGSWQGSRIAAGGRVALLGTTMAPGFEPGDYEPGVRQVLQGQYPSHASWISRLTR